MHWFGVGVKRADPHHHSVLDLITPHCLILEWNLLRLPLVLLGLH
jgi:hypothetical protein